MVAANPGRTIAVGSHGGVLSHLLARHADDLPPEFWRRIRNPHVFIFDARGPLAWTGERTFAGGAGRPQRLRRAATGSHRGYNFDAHEYLS